MLDTHLDFVAGSARATQAAVRDPQHNAIAALLDLEDILLDVEAVTQAGVFSHIATSLGVRHHLRTQAVVAGLDEREKLGSTALGQGVAIPHARLAGLAQTIAVFVRLRTAIPFAAPDGKPVSTLLVLLVPENATDAHLELLAQVASMFCAKAFRDRLNACVTAAEILATWATWRST